jgi:hypothetical protein
VWVEASARCVKPDATVIQGGIGGGQSEVGGVALATRTQPLVFEVTDDERTEMGVSFPHSCDSWFVLS